MNHISKYFLLIVITLTCNFSNAQESSYPESVKNLRQYFDNDLKKLFGYNTNSGCYIKKITEEMSKEGDYGDASYFCLKIKEFEYIKNANKVFIIMGGPAVDAKNSIIQNLPDTNEQAYAYYLIPVTVQDNRKTNGKFSITYGKFEFLTDRTENFTRIACINSKPVVGFIYQTTSFLGRGMNGFEIDSEFHIGELGSGFFGDRLNFTQTKNNNLQTYKNGACVKSK
jgi:hypothetical protein